MATKIILKKSSTAGAVPLAGDLDLGELAVNVVDRKVYTKNNAGAIIKLDGAYVDAVAPSTPAEGDIWYDTANNLLKAYNGSAWEAAGYTTLAQFGVTATATELNYVDGVTSSIQTQLDGKASTSHTHVVANITDLTATATELNYVDGVTSSIQTQLNGKAALSHTHVVANITDLTATATELNYVDGVTSAIQTQLDGKAASSHTHTSANITDFAEAVQDVVGAAVTAGTGISVSYNDAGTGTITVTNSAPDQTVALTAGAAITVTGTYPNFTIAHTDTSTQASVDNTGATVIQDVTLDTNGHVTGLASVAITPALIGAAATSHSHTAANITDFTEAAQDAVGTIISGAGIASVVYNDAANTIVVTATEADTLQTVTNRGATTTNGITVASVTTTGDITIGGNLTVNGTTTTVNSNTVNIGDNIIVLNADETNAPSQSAGFEVERGTSANVSFLWDETNDVWTLGDQTLAGVRLDGGTY